MAELLCQRRTTAPHGWSLQKSHTAPASDRAKSKDTRAGHPPADDMGHGGAGALPYSHQL